MSLDDQLRDLIRTGGPAPSSLEGDLGAVRTTVRRRVRRRRVAVGMAAAAVVLAGAAGALIAGTHHGRVDTDDRPAGQDTRPPTTPTTAALGTTVPTTAGATPTTTATTPATTLAPAPSIRDVDLQAATYADACPAYDDHRSATLRNGTARLPFAGGGGFFDVELGPVSYADADGDGHDDAVMILRCTFAGADVDTSAQLRAYRATPSGAIEQIGSSQVVEHIHDATVAGLTATVTVDVYAPNDAACCPSGGARQQWRFDGDRFTLVASTAIPPPGA